MTEQRDTEREFLELAAKLSDKRRVEMLSQRKAAEEKGTPAPSDQLEDKRTDRDWIEQNLKIVSKRSKVIPFQLNFTQTKLDEVYEREKKKGKGQKPVHIIGLKGRQYGWTTWTAGRIFAKCVRQENQAALSLVHDKDGADWVFGIVRRFYDLLPVDSPFRLPTDYSNRREIIFSTPHMSQMSVQVAHQYAGSAFTLSMLHISELGKWTDAPTTMLSVLQAAAHADIIIEATANGETGRGKYFYEMWQGAKKGDNEYVPVFYAWFDHEEYEIPGVPEDALKLTAEEQSMREKHNLRMGQFAWRRWAIKELCNNDEEAFRQEYPANDVEAFRKVEGERVFNINRCRVYLTQSVSPLAQGDLVWGIAPRLDVNGFCMNRGDLTVQFVPDEIGPMRVWEFPPEVTLEKLQPNRFIGAADVAEGVKDGDLSAAAILDRGNPMGTSKDRGKKIICAYHSLIDATQFGSKLAQMAIWYNAQMAPETNSYGTATIHRFMALTNLAWPAQQWMRGMPFSMPEGRTWGWYTPPGNAGARAIMVQKLVDVIREMTWWDPDALAWQDIMSVVRAPSGNPILNGKDFTVVRCILAVMDFLLPQIIQRKEGTKAKDLYGEDDPDRPRREEPPKDYWQAAFGTSRGIEQIMTGVSMEPFGLRVPRDHDDAIPGDTDEKGRH